MGWLVLGLVIAALLTWQVLRARRRRVLGLSRLALQARLNYSPEDVIGLHDRYYNLRLIRTGHSRGVSDTVYGSTRNGLVAVFRYCVEVGFGAQQARRSWWMAALESPEPRVPCLGLRAVAEAQLVPAEHYPHVLTVGGWSIHYRHQTDQAVLDSAAMGDLLARWPAEWVFEGSGRVVLVRAPDDGDDTAKAVLDAVQLIGPMLATN